MLAADMLGRLLEGCGKGVATLPPLETAATLPASVCIHQTDGLKTEEILPLLHVCIPGGVTVLATASPTASIAHGQKPTSSMSDKRASLCAKVKEWRVMRLRTSAGRPASFEGAEPAKTSDPCCRRRSSKENKSREFENISQAFVAVRVEDQQTEMAMEGEQDAPVQSWTAGTALTVSARHHETTKGERTLYAMGEDHRGLDGNDVELGERGPRKPRLVDDDEGWAGQRDDNRL